MLDIMNLPKKVVLTAAVGFFANFAFGQTVQEGIQNLERLERFTIQ